MQTNRHFLLAACGLVASSAFGVSGAVSAREIGVGEGVVERDRESTNVRVHLLSESPTVKAGQVVTLALHFVIEPEWHMYWNGYAEEGMEPNWEWSLPEGWQVQGEVVWPVPHRNQPSEFVVEHVYEHSLTLLVPVRVSVDAAAGTARASVRAKWLVCSDRCVPESGEDAIELRVVSEAQPGAAGSDGKTGQEGERISSEESGKIIEGARKDLARLMPMSATRADELGVTAKLVRTGDGARLELRGGDKVRALTWFPANECARPSSEFGAWTAEGWSLDVPFEVAYTKQTPGKAPESEDNRLHSVCVQGILEVKSGDAPHNASEYFVVKLSTETDR